MERLIFLQLGLEQVVVTADLVVALAVASDQQYW